MKINIDNETLSDKILINLKEKKPYLITRFGEGEMRMFNGGNESEWIIKNMIGYVPKKKVMVEIISNLELGLINSDVTGLPSYKNLISEEDVINSPIHELYKSTYNVFRGVFKKHNKSEEDFLYCDVNSHTKFLNQNLYQKLLNNIDELTIITCREVTNEMKNFFNIKNIKHYKIPPEYRFEDDPSKIKWNFYPEVHKEIKTDILNSDNKGKLCLYGAGIIGKDLGVYFKQSGGVAFDVGSVFDYWFGKVTRGPKKGKNVYVKSPLI